MELRIFEQVNLHPKTSTPRAQNSSSLKIHLLLRQFPCYLAVSSRRVNFQHRRVENCHIYPDPNLQNLLHQTSQHQLQLLDISFIHQDAILLQELLLRIFLRHEEVSSPNRSKVIGSIPQGSLSRNLRVIETLLTCALQISIDMMNGIGLLFVLCSKW